MSETPRQAALQKILDVFAQSFRSGRDLLDYFGSVGSVIWAKEVPGFVQGPKGSWYLLVRLDPQWEELFGLSREFVVYCTEVPDLQVRLVRQATRLIHHVRQKEGRHVEAGHAVIFTLDWGAEDKVRDWGPTADLTVVPLTAQIIDRAKAGEDDQPASVLGRWLHLKNLYEERGPVTGDRFFGRDAVLAQIFRMAMDGDHVGIFGIRRIGKTSVLRQLRARLAAQEMVIPVDHDLQSSSAAGSAAHVAYSLGWRLGDLIDRTDTAPLTKHDVRDVELALPRRWNTEDPGTVISNVCDGVLRLLEERLPDHRFVLILDEAEVLVPRGAWLDHALELLRGLRAVAQQTGRLSLVLAGVNATPCEEPVVAGEDNPMFGSLAPLYLGPLDGEAAVELIRVVGSKMGLSWDGALVDALIEDVGAHPFLARLAAAEIADRHPHRPCNVQHSNVAEVLDGLPRARHNDLEQMLDGLRRHYPSELEVLRLVFDGDAPNEEMETAYPREMRHLTAYGLVDSRSGRVAVPVLQRWFERYHPA